MMMSLSIFKIFFTKENPLYGSIFFLSPSRLSAITAQQMEVHNRILPLRGFIFLCLSLWTFLWRQTLSSWPSSSGLLELVWSCWLSPLKTATTHVDLLGKQKSLIRSAANNIKISNQVGLESPCNVLSLWTPTFHSELWGMCQLSVCEWPGVKFTHLSSTIVTSYTTSTVCRPMAGGCYDLLQ